MSIGVTDGGTRTPAFLLYSKGKEGKGGEEKLRTPTFRSKVTPMIASHWVNDVVTRVRVRLKSGLESDFAGLGLGLRAERLGLGLGLGLDLRRGGLGRWTWTLNQWTRTWPWTWDLWT